MGNNLIELIKRAAAKYGLDPAIVFGVCMQESLMQPGACRFERAYRWLFQPQKVKPGICSLDTEIIFQKISWGLMQVMGGVFREYGLQGWLPREVSDPEVQLEYGCRHLASKIKQYGRDPGILAYNSGAPIRNEKTGEYINQEYLWHVLTHAKAFPG